MTETQRAYRAFLRTEFWKSLSAEKKAAVGKCERCGSPEALQSHHRFYRADWLETKLEDLEVLCRACHRAEHRLTPERTWWFSENEEIEYFYFACEQGHANVRLSECGREITDPIDLDELKEIAARYPEEGGMQFQILLLIYWTEWLKSPDVTPHFNEWRRLHVITPP